MRILAIIIQIKQLTNSIHFSCELQEYSRIKEKLPCNKLSLALKCVSRILLKNLLLSNLDSGGPCFCYLPQKNEKFKNNFSINYVYFQ